MFRNIGKKIKTLALVICWVQIVINVIGGIAAMVAIGRVVNPAAGFFLGLLIIALGVLIAWIGSFLLYGFGQLVDNSDRMTLYLSRMAPTPRRQAQPMPSPQQVQQGQQMPQYPGQNM